MRAKYSLAALAAIMGLGAVSAQAQDRFIGEIVTVGFNFCPRGSVAAEGQLLAISQNTALFSLYGTMYGGDGRTTFALPDLRGRIVMGPGNGPGLTPRRIGEKGGAETSRLNSITPVKPDPSSPESVTVAGTGEILPNLPPYQVMLNCVVLYGMFPSRN